MKSMSSLLSVMLTCRCCPHSLSVGARGRAPAVGLVQPNGLGGATLGRRDLYTSTFPFRGPFPSAVWLPVGINRLPDVEFLNLSYQKSWVSLLPSDELLPPQLAFHGQSPGGWGALRQSTPGFCQHHLELAGRVPRAPSPTGSGAAWAAAGGWDRSWTLPRAFET